MPKVVVHWHKLGEVENKSTLRNSIVLAIFVPKTIKVGENVTKLREKQFLLFFSTMYVEYFIGALLAVCANL